MTREARPQGQGRVTTFRESELKLCELCGWLNLESNTECFVCGWHGHFDHSPDVVRAAIELTVRQYGRLELHHVTDPHTYRNPPPPTLRMRLLAWFRRLWNWLRG